MRLWQQTMIRLARNGFVTRAMHGSRLLDRFARQFVGGQDAPAGVDRARELHELSMAASLFYLGEYVDTPELVDENVRALEAVIPLLAESGLDVHVSVDPTQVGAMLSWDQCRENVFRLARAVAATETGARKALMLDMEDSSVTQPTLDLYHSLRDAGLDAAVTVQTYLHRSREDLAALAERGAMVRVVKGAFAESPDIAYTNREEKDRAYRAGIDTLFSRAAKERSVYPVLGTHDHTAIAYAEQTARENGWAPDQWEVEMLLGVRPNLQRALVNRGVALRLYLPFGTSWWPYSVRRIGENPRNLWFVARSVAFR